MELFNKDFLDNLPSTKYVIGVDCVDDNANAYCLMRIVGENSEIMLCKSMKKSKEFDEEVENLIKYFDATLISNNYEPKDRKKEKHFWATEVSCKFDIGKIQIIELDRNKKSGLWINDPAKIGYEVIYPDKTKSVWDKIDPSLATWIPNAPFKVIGSHTLSKEHRAYLIVDRVENIVGRGKVLIIDLIKNKLTEDKYIDEIPFKKGDSITTDLGKFVIRDIESQSNLMNGKFNSTIGILIHAHQC